MLPCFKLNNLVNSIYEKFALLFLTKFVQHSFIEFTSGTNITNIFLAQYYYKLDYLKIWSKTSGFIKIMFLATKVSMPVRWLASQSVCQKTTSLKNFKNSLYGVFHFAMLWNNNIWSPVISNSFLLQKFRIWVSWSFWIY